MPFEVCKRCIKETWALDWSEADVALVAKKAANITAIMAVIDDEVVFRQPNFTNFTPEGLLFQKGTDFIIRDAVAPLVMSLSALLCMALWVFEYPFFASQSFPFWVFS